MKILNQVGTAVMGLALLATVPVFLSASAAMAQSAPSSMFDLSGVHRGHLTDRGGKNEVDLMIHPNPATKGSYLAVIMRVEPIDQVAIYMVDPVNESQNRFEMKRFQVQPDGEIGVPSATPSLILTVNGSFGDKKPTLTITNSNAPLEAGEKAIDDFKGPIDFYGGTETHAWTPLIAGRYYPRDNDHKHKFFDIGAEDGNFESATSLLLSQELNGTATLEESQPGLFALKVVQYSGSGQTVGYPKKIGFFIQREGTVRFVVVNADNFKEVFVLEKK